MTGNRDNHQSLRKYIKISIDISSKMSPSQAAALYCLASTVKTHMILLIAKIKSHGTCGDNKTRSINRNFF